MPSCGKGAPSSPQPPNPPTPTQAMSFIHMLPVCAAPGLALAPSENPQGTLCSGPKEWKGDASRRKSRENVGLLSPGNSPEDTSRGSYPTGKACVRQLCAQEQGAVHNTAEQGHAICHMPMPASPLQQGRREASGKEGRLPKPAACRGSPLTISPSH